MGAIASGLEEHELEIYRARRQRLFDSLPDDTVALFPAAPTSVRNADIQHEYRPDSDVFYLTGFPEPECLVVLTKDRMGCRYELLVRPRDRDRERWEGPRAGEDGAVEGYGADAGHPISVARILLMHALGTHRHLLYGFGVHKAMDRELLVMLGELRHMQSRGYYPPAVILDPLESLHEQRLVKDEAALKALRRAASITIAGHQAAMRELEPGLGERDLQVVIESTFRRQGSPRNGYPTIVAGGERGAILHYLRNDHILEADTLVLIDAGAEVQHHTADVTRTLPVSGTFSPVQRDVYSLVLAAQEAALAACRPGALVDRLHEIVLEVFTAGLRDLGILDGDLDRLLEHGAHRPWVVHKSVHWLGMDVHDVGRYRIGGKSRELVPNMVLSVEPGLYFRADDERVPERFRGIAARVEDNALITEGEPDILTAGCPKQIDELEAALAG